MDPEIEIYSNLKLVNSKSGVSTNTYSDNITYTRLVATFEVEREPLGVVLRTLLPATIITGVSLIIFFIPKNLQPRITMTILLLLSLAYLHQTNLGHIPTVGYLTIFDKIMIIYYMLFVNSIIALGVQMKIDAASDKKENTQIKKYNKLQLYLVPAIIVSVMVILWNLLLAMKFSSQREQILSDARNDS